MGWLGGGWGRGVASCGDVALGWGHLMGAAVDILWRQ